MGESGRKVMLAIAVQANNHHSTEGKVKKLVVDPIVNMAVRLILFLILLYAEPFHNVYDDNYEAPKNNITSSTNELKENIVYEAESSPKVVGCDSEENDLSQYNSTMINRPILVALMGWFLQPERAPTFFSR